MTMIMFDANGRAFWKSVTTDVFRQIQKKECHFTKQDKEWFRKPLAKGVDY